MTGPEHYRQAQKIITEQTRIDQNPALLISQVLAALTHAVLAQTAADVLFSLPWRGDTDGMEQWEKAITDCPQEGR